MFRLQVQIAYIFEKKDGNEGAQDQKIHLTKVAEDKVEGIGLIMSDDVHNKRRGWLNWKVFHTVQIRVSNIHIEVISRDLHLK